MAIAQRGGLHAGKGRQLYIDRVEKGRVALSDCYALWWARKCRSRFCSTDRGDLLRKPNRLYWNEPGWRPPLPAASGERSGCFGLHFGGTGCGFRRCCCFFLRGLFTCLGRFPGGCSFCSGLAGVAEFLDGAFEQLADFCAGAA